MSFSSAQLREMLESYEADHGTGMKPADMAQEIHDDTDGYPYLVSGLCQLPDSRTKGTSNKGTWTRDSLLDAVRDLVLKRFVQHFTESFAGSTDRFIKDNGRKLFLLANQ